jgi:CheY-like chemotaxis protein
MQIYIFENNDHPLQAEIGNLLQAQDTPFEVLEWPDDPEIIADSIPSTPEGGIIWLPAVWDDLKTVKCIENLLTLRAPWQIAVAGDCAETNHLAAAFNAGLTQFLPLPANREALSVVMRRLEKQWSRQVNLIKNMRTASAGNPGITPESPTEIRQREKYLGQALFDLATQTGPLIEAHPRLLYVCTSSAQQAPIREMLTRTGLQVKIESSIAAGVAAMREHQYAVVLSDYILDGGTAIELIRRMRQAINEKMPYIIVLSSSPEKTRELNDPASGIDQVIRKPDPQTGIEVILPSVIAGIYQQV